MTLSRCTVPLAAWPVLLLLAADAALAGSAADVPTPVFEQGEASAGLKFGQARLRNRSRDAEGELSVGYALTSHWYSELKGLWAKAPGQRHDFDAWAWENKFLLTKADASAFDLALSVEVARPQDRSAGYGLSWGPQLQGRLNEHLQANLNLQFSKAVRTSQAGPTELSYSWQLKHDWRPEAEFGLQGLGELGPWRDWSAAARQAHVAGPALFGSVKLNEKQAINLNGAWLFGLGLGAPRHTLRVAAELAF